MKKAFLSILCLVFVACSTTAAPVQRQVKANPPLSINGMKLLKCFEETKVNYLAQMLIKACKPHETSIQYPHGPTILANFRGEVIAKKQYREGSLVLCEKSRKTIPKLNQPQKKMVRGFLTDCPTN